MTREEMIECGRRIGAFNAVIRTPDDKRHPQVMYVLEDGIPALQAVVADALDPHCFIEVVNLKGKK